MFQNRISGFTMGFENQNGQSAKQPTSQHERSLVFVPTPVRISDIYHAALNRAVHDHELDKLFNPDFYDYQI